ncbi:MAG: SoxR reducing system RseC family protein [Oscillibacter sp.]|nr:SoxR reducing system RseC family protein [Oscillibacter sp.]
MTQIATVERVLDDRCAEISVPRKSACGHDCESCAGCGVTGAAVLARAENSIGAGPGDKVVVESSTRSLLGIAALVYLVPLVGFFLLCGLAALLGASGGSLYAAGGLGFLLGLLPPALYDRKMQAEGGLSFTIVRYF